MKENANPVASIADVPNRWLTLQSVLVAVRRRWVFVVLLTTGATASAVGVSLMMSDWYRSEVVAVMTTRALGGLAGALGELGSLASLAGLSLPGSESDQREEAIQYLRSDALARRFIEKSGLMQRIYMPSLKVPELGWLVNDRADAPTLNDAVDYFKQRMAVVSYDRRTGVVRVAMLWRDPGEAAQLANDFVSLANEDLRSRAVAESERKLNYLRGLDAETADVGQRRLVSQLIQSEISFGTLANARPDYAFRVVDAAVAPDVDQPALPRRGVIAVTGLFAGLLMGVALALLADIFVGRRRAEGHNH